MTSHQPAAPLQRIGWRFGFGWFAHSSGCVRGNAGPSFCPTFQACCQGPIWGTRLPLPLLAHPRTTGRCKLSARPCWLPAVCWPTSSSPRPCATLFLLLPNVQAPPAAVADTTVLVAGHLQEPLAHYFYCDLRTSQGSASDTVDYRFCSCRGRACRAGNFSISTTLTGEMAWHLLRHLMAVLGL